MELRITVQKKVANKTHNEDLHWVGNVFTIGRATNVFKIIDQSISKQHARILEINGTLTVEDLKSRNGTYVNGKKVTSSALVVGDIIRVAGVLLRIESHKSTSAKPEASLEQMPVKREASLAQGWPAQFVCLPPVAQKRHDGLYDKTQARLGSLIRS